MRMCGFCPVVVIECTVYFCDSVKAFTLQVMCPSRLVPFRGMQLSQPRKQHATTHNSNHAEQQSKQAGRQAGRHAGRGRSGAPSRRASHPRLGPCPPSCSARPGTFFKYTWYFKVTVFVFVKEKERGRKWQILFFARFVLRYSIALASSCLEYTSRDFPRT